MSKPYEIPVKGGSFIRHEDGTLKPAAVAEEKPAEKPASKKVKGKDNG